MGCCISYWNVKKEERKKVYMVEEDILEDSSVNPMSRQSHVIHVKPRIFSIEEILEYNAKRQNEEFDRVLTTMMEASSSSEH
jgi:hypothetical protein